MRVGFNKAIDYARVTSTNQTDIQQGLKEITADNMRSIFNGKNAITTLEFLRLCHFTSSVSSKFQEMFETCGGLMSSAEGCRLGTFITGLEYFGSQKSKVELASNATKESLICASTCFTKLSLLTYHNVEIMYRKVCIAIMDHSLKDSLNYME